MSRISFQLFLALVLLIIIHPLVITHYEQVEKKSTLLFAQEYEPFEDQTKVSFDEKLQFYLNENTIHVIKELYDRELQLANLVQIIHDEVAARGKKGIKDDSGFTQVFGAQEEIIKEYERELAWLVKVYDDLNYLKEIADYVNDVDNSMNVLDAKSNIFAALDDRELFKKGFYTPEYIGRMVDEYTDELDSLLNIYDALEHIKVRAEAYNDQEALGQIQSQEAQVLKILSQWGKLGPLSEEDYQQYQDEIQKAHETVKDIKSQETAVLSKDLDRLREIEKGLVNSLDKTVYDLLANAEYSLDVFPTVEEFSKNWKAERLADVKVRLTQYQIIWNKLLSTADEDQKKRMYSAELNNGLLNYSQQKYRTAEYQFLDILNQYDLLSQESIAIKYYIGEARWHRLAYQQAKEQFEELASSTPSNYTIESLVRLMQYELDFGTSAQFYQYYNLVEQNREYGRGDIVYYAHYLVANKQFENRQYFEAQKLLDKIPETSEFYLPSQLLKGIILNNLNKFDEAIPIFTALTAEKSYPWTDLNVADIRNTALLRLGLIYYQKGQFFNAIENFDKVSKGFEKYDEALISHAWAKFRQNDFESAQQLSFELLRDQFASDFTYEALVLYGHCNQILNSNENALDAYRYVVRARGVLDVKKDFDNERTNMRDKVDQLELIEDQAIDKRQAGLYLEISRLKNELNEFLVATRERGDTGTQLIQDYYEERLDVVDRLVELDEIIEWAFNEGRGDVAVKADQQRTRLIAALETYQGDQTVSNTTYLVDYPLAAREASMVYRRETWGDVYRDMSLEKGRIEQTLADVEEYQARLSTAGAVSSKMDLEVLQFDINNLRDRLDLVRKAMTETGFEQPNSNADYWSDISGFGMSDIIYKEREEKLEQIDDYANRLQIIKDIFQTRQDELFARVDEFETDLIRIQNNLLSRKIQLEQLEKDTYFRNYYFETREFEEETWEDRLRQLQD